VIKINYFDKRKLLVIREINTKAPKSPNTKSSKCYLQRQQEKIYKVGYNLFAAYNTIVYHGRHSFYSKS